tara:strand:- start:1987 stop:2202 length:216 start_codon:yes stop_codon:yes gene_type:complete
MAAKAKKVESETVKTLPVCPAIYVDGAINMHSSMITTEEAFLKLLKGSRAAKSIDLEKAYSKAKKWREKFQ